MFSSAFVCLYVSRITQILNRLSQKSKGSGRRFGMGGEQNHRDLGTGVPQRGPGAEPRLAFPEAEEFVKLVTSKFYAFFGYSISHIITYICLCFSVLAGIIPLSLRNGGGGI